MEIVRQPEKTMILRFHIAEGEVGEGKEAEKFTLGYSSKGLVWYFQKEARYYTIDYKSLTEDVLKFREQGGGK